MKIILSFIAVFFISASVCAQKAEEKLAVNSVSQTMETVGQVKSVEPVLSMKEEVFDFGKIPQGKPVTHNFEVTNNGTSPFTIANVQASCGCTTPEWEKDKPVLPGGTTNIKVGYNAAAEGPFNKTVTIMYGENLAKQIIIKGEVWKTPAASAPENTGLNELKN